MTTVATTGSLSGRELELGRILGLLDRAATSPADALPRHGPRPSQRRVRVRPEMRNVQRELDVARPTAVRAFVVRF